MCSDNAKALEICLYSDSTSHTKANSKNTRKGEKNGGSRETEKETLPTETSTPLITLLLHSKSWVTTENAGSGKEWLCVVMEVVQKLILTTVQGTTSQTRSTKGWIMVSAQT